MGYPSEKYFDITYVERTKEILDEYKGKYDFTMLINCLLGLIILPNEYNMQDKREFNFDFLEQKVLYFPKIKNIFKNATEKLRNEKGKEFDQRKFLWISKSGNEMSIDDIKLSELINRIRHGFAHMNITPTKDGDYWAGIRVRNYPDENKPEYFNFEVYFTQSELYDFAVFIAEKYIATVKK